MENFMEPEKCTLLRDRRSLNLLNFFQVLSEIPFGDVSKIRFREFKSFNRSLTSPLIDFKEYIRKDFFRCEASL